MMDHATDYRHQVRMMAGRKACRHLARRKSVTGEITLEDLHCHIPDHARTVAPAGFADDSRSALSQDLPDFQISPINRRHLSL